MERLRIEAASEGVDVNRVEHMCRAGETLVELEVVGGPAEGEPKHDDLEKWLAQGSIIATHTITLDGDADGRNPRTAL